MTKGMGPCKYSSICLWWPMKLWWFQFSWVAQLCLIFATPWTAARQDSLSITNSWMMSFSNSCPSSRWCHPTVSSSVGPLWYSSCPSPLPILLWRHLQVWKQHYHLLPRDKGSPTSTRIISTEMYPLPSLTLIQRFTRLSHENPERTSENSVSTGSLWQFTMRVPSSWWNNSLQKKQVFSKHQSVWGPGPFTANRNWLPG